LFEIFSRLPSKAIARCRCVSKLWASMLRCQDFFFFFLKNLLSIFHRVFFDQTFFSLPSSRRLSQKIQKENSYVVAANQLARFPSAYGFSARTSGFFCYQVEHIFEGSKVPEFVPVICNPSTGQSLILPTLKSRKRFGVESYLGYEPIAKEFKVLSMECSCESGEWISAKHQVLTLGTNKLSWRFVECCIPHLSSSKWMCISGVLYYAAAAYSSYERTMVACFDLRSEKFSFVNFSRAMPSSTTLVNYNGKLGLLMSGDLGDFGDIAILLWVLRDAGKNEWSKHV
ncbi:unnamed protein product, partial [Brassica oleracea]